MRRVALSLALIAAPQLAAQAPNQYRITHTYVLGGDGRWDYVTPDPARHRVFIGRETRVMVVDERDGTLLGAVAGILGAHGGALMESAHPGFVTSGDVRSAGRIVPITTKMLRPHPARPAADEMY